MPLELSVCPAGGAVVAAVVSGVITVVVEDRSRAHINESGPSQLESVSDGQDSTTSNVSQCAHRESVARGLPRQWLLLTSARPGRC